MAKKRQRSRGQGTLFKRDGRGPWIASWYDHTGKRRERSTRTTDKAAAERILAKHVSDAALRRGGVIDAKLDHHAAAARRPLGEHVGAFIGELKARGVTREQVSLVESRANRIIELCKAKSLVDLSGNTVSRAIGQVREAGASVQTCNHYLRAIKQFTRWLVRDGRMAVDPIAHLKTRNAEAHRKHIRRELTDGELGRLIEAADRGPVVRHMTGPDRAMLY